jgi:hypothetical protein
MTSLREEYHRPVQRESGLLLGQRRRGVPLRDPEEGADPRPAVADKAGGDRRRHRLDGELLQHTEETLDPELLDTPRIRARIQGHQRTSGLNPDSTKPNTLQSQYTSKEFTEFTEYCERNTIVRSKGKVACCWDNAVAESLFATLKKELVHARPWPTWKSLTDAVTDWIDDYYNTQRRHSTLNYLTPREYALVSRS